MKAVLLIDDLDHYNGHRTEADDTHLLSLDGVVVELDLTDAHHKELADQLEPWFKIGHKPSGPSAPPAAPWPPSGSKMSASRAYLAGLRAWADAAGREDEYHTETGHFYYPVGLRAEYDAYLEGQH